MIPEKWFQEMSPLKGNDTVLVFDNNLPRGKWRLGKVEKTLVGRDGLIRTVSIRTMKGVISRPVQKVHRDLLLTDAKASQETHS